jgi:hypothetical protein
MIPKESANSLQAFPRQHLTHYEYGTEVARLKAQSDTGYKRTQIVSVLHTLEYCKSESLLPSVPCP